MRKDACRAGLAVLVLLAALGCRLSRPQPGDPAVEAAIVAADWAKVATAAEAWQKRDPRSLVPPVVLEYAFERTGLLEDAQKAGRAVRRAFYNRRFDWRPVTGWARGLATRHPNSADAWGMASHALALAREYPKAAHAAAEALRLAPHDWAAWAQSGSVRLSLGDSEGAVKALSEALKLHPGDAWVLSKLANAYREDTDYGRALADAHRAQQLDPRFAPTYLIRQRVYYDKGQYDKAIADCDRATELDPGGVVAYVFLAYAHRAQGKDRASLEDAERAVQLAPAYAAAHLALGRAQAAMGDDTRSAKEYRRAIALLRNPRCALDYLVRGDAYMELHDSGVALDDFRRAVKLEPSYAPAWQRVANAEVNLGHYSEGVADATKAINLQGGDAATLTLRAAAYAAQGLVGSAIADLDSAITRNPDDVQSYVLRGLLYQQENYLADAQRDFHQAQRLDPKHAIEREASTLSWLEDARECYRSGQEQRGWRPRETAGDTIRRWFGQ